MVNESSGSHPEDINQLPRVEDLINSASVPWWLSREVRKNSPGVSSLSQPCPQNSTYLQISWSGERPHGQTVTFVKAPIDELSPVSSPQPAHQALLGAHLHLEIPVSEKAIARRNP